MIPEQIRKHREARKNYVPPGDMLKRIFERYMIRQKITGCTCSDVQAFMNALGVDGCQANIKDVVRRVRDSIIEWKEGSRIIPTPPNLLIKLFVQKAINDSRKTMLS